MANNNSKTAKEQNKRSEHKTLEDVLTEWSLEGGKDDVILIDDWFQESCVSVKAFSSLSVVVLIPQSIEFSFPE